MSGKTRLRGEPDRRICGAEPGICPSLYNFEEKAAIEIFRIGLEILADAGLCHPPVGLNLYVASGIAKMGSPN